MKTKFINLVSSVLLFLGCLTMNAQYSETLDPNGLSKNLREDYNFLDDNAATNQSDKLQRAIDDLNSLGGGQLIMPKGTYSFSSINLKSNVHILIEAGTVIKPALGDGVVFSLTTEKSVEKENKQAFIENVSIRGIGGSFTIDYHTLLYNDKQRAIIAKMVKNFLISDMIVKDNYTVYCGITLTLTDEAGDISNWEVTRATNGTIRNITHYKASPGYGLVQCHGAQSVHFENLYSLGGVTLRLEVGANFMHVGVYDITAKNIINENGRCALMLGPHSAKNGIINVDGIKSIGSSFALTIGDGGVKEGAPDQTPGYFHEDSVIKNIHAIWGPSAQFKGASFLEFPNRDYYDTMKIWSDNKFFDGPSIGAVKFESKSYSVNIENVTLEGFPYNSEKTILKEEDEREGDQWDEKEYWEKTHQGSEWISDKGVLNEDYVAVAYDFNKVITKEVIENDNFLIKVTGETCPNQNNGKIEITAKLEKNYKVELNGVEFNFTDKIVLENLNPNIYDLCISVSELNFKSCFTIDINTAQSISAKALVKNGKAFINIETGTSPYTILLNGDFVLNTFLNKVEIDVNPGDKIEVSSNKVCEGFFSKNVEVNNEIIVYPNPSSDLIFLKTSFVNVPYVIYDLFGKEIKEGVYQNKGINISELTVGVYVIRIDNLNSKFIKI